MALVNYPRFRFDEVVRVLHVPVYDERDDDDDDAHPVIGMEGVVCGIGPDHEPSRWGYSVWLPELERVWGFDESDLESVGLVEVEEHEPGSRVALDPNASPHESFGGELGVRLFLQIAADDAAGTAAKAIAELSELIPVAHVTWEDEVHPCDRPGCRRIRIQITPAGDSREAFESLVASRRDGRVRQVDDGWATDFWWSRAAEGGDEPFLGVQASDAALRLTPWSDPFYRPVRRGRTHDPGLPGYTPPDPPAGYEN